LIHCNWYLIDKPLHHPRGKRKADGQKGNDQTGTGIVDEKTSALEEKSGKSITSQGAKKGGEHCRGKGNDGAVKKVDAEVLPHPNPNKAIHRGFEGYPCGRNPKGLCLGFQGSGKHPSEWKKAIETESYQENPKDGFWKKFF